MENQHSFITKLLVAFFLMVVNFHGIQGQSFYHLKFKSIENKHLEINGFLIRNIDQASSSLRIQFIDLVSKTMKVIAFKIKEEMTDSFTLVLSPVEPVYIKGATGTVDYKADLILFRKDNGSDYFAPVKIAKLQKNHLVEGDFSSIQFFRETDITTHFLSAYYNKDEPLYLKYKNEGRGDGSFPLTSAAKLYFIVATDINDSTIKKDCLKDIDNLENFYNSIAAKLGIEWYHTRLTGTDYSKEALSNTLNQLHPGPDDIVVFHYTGHGFHPSASHDSFPYMFLLNDKTTPWTDIMTYGVSVQEVYSLIRSKGARLNILIADCCNDIQLVPKVRAQTIPISRDGITYNTEACIKLFLQSRLSFIAAPAKIGEYSRSTPTNGAIYTFTYLQALNTMLSQHFNFNGNLSWDDVLKQADVSTLAISKNYVNKFGTEFKMTPFFHVDR